MLRVGVNALYLIPGGVGGTEIYLRNLLSALAGIDSANEYVLFTNRETGPDLVPNAPNFRLVPQKVRASFRPARILWEQTVLPVAAARERVDVLFNPGFTAPTFTGRPSVTVFHDLQHKRHPEYFRWYDLPFWRLLLYSSAHRSRILLADSEPTRADLIRYYGLPPEKIRTVHLGVDPAFFRIGCERRTRVLKPYILCASTLHPHKNLESLIRAYAELQRTHPDLSLVLTGVRGFHAEAVERLIAALGLERHIRITGWVPRSELYDLFRDAWAFVYPSTFEGFGLPVVEALAAGVPVACSSIEPLSGIAGDAALKFDPHDEKALLKTMDRLVSDAALRSRLSEEGPRRAQLYSWRKTAELTLEALLEAARV